MTHAPQTLADGPAAAPLAWLLAGLDGLAIGLALFDGDRLPTLACVTVTRVGASGPERMTT